MRALLPPRHVCRGFGLFPVRSPLLGESLACFLLLRLLRCFNSAGWPPPEGRYPDLSRDGLPHSDICGSQPGCGSPQLFAACHVLLRLTIPRHPPCALSYFRLYDLHRPAARLPFGTPAPARKPPHLWLLPDGSSGNGDGMYVSGSARHPPQQTHDARS